MKHTKVYLIENKARKSYVVNFMHPLLDKKVSRGFGGIAQNTPEDIEEKRKELEELINSVSIEKLKQMFIKTTSFNNKLINLVFDEKVKEEEITDDRILQLIDNIQRAVRVLELSSSEDMIDKLCKVSELVTSACKSRLATMNYMRLMEDYE